ncbi:MAG TPA: polyamine aminopropyltransferase [Nitrosospira sp.]|nr:polyamine aminopropyltransferase [Nitrosospira sp.]
MGGFLRGGRRNANSGGGFGSGSGSDSLVHLSEEYGIRSLHLGSSMVQSTMRIAAPNELQLAYTQCMMCFLLFHPRPKNVLMIGLGGGSLTKFVYWQLPKVKTTVIEINPQVVSIARSQFYVPADDERLQVLIGEGSEYLAAHAASTDVLMVDGFDDGRQVAALCTQAFYDHASKALTRNGVLVVNLLSRDGRVHEYLARLENSFGGCIATILAEPYGNLIVFAFKRAPTKPAWEELQATAKALEKEFSLPFTKFAQKLPHRRPF